MAERTLAMVALRENAPPLSPLPRDQAEARAVALRTEHEANQRRNAYINRYQATPPWEHPFYEPFDRFDEEAYRARRQEEADRRRHEAAEEARAFEAARAAVEPPSVRIARLAPPVPVFVNINPYGELSDD
jgi:hypothetical protein